MGIVLRDYQQKLVDAIRAEFAAGHSGVMAVSPTGSGKTVVFSYIAENSQKLGNTTYILVHRKELITQTANSLKRNGIKFGVIAAGHPYRSASIQICSVQTLTRRLDYFDPPDLIIIDECHHASSKSYENIIQWAGSSALLGVTATPIRTDGQGFKKYFSSMVCGPDVAELVNAGWLSRPVIYAPPVDIDLSKIHTVAGDYDRGELAAELDKPVITGSAVEHYKRLLPHHPPSVAFCVSIAHAKHVADEFIKNGIQSASIDGTMEAEERARLISDLKNGKIKVLTSCDLISEGFDLPAISAAIMLRPTKSLALYIQQAGRGLRPSEGKAETIILDHVQNWLRHGTIDEPREWTLEGRDKKAKSQRAQTLTTCEQCYAVYPFAPACPSCGFVKEAAKKQQIQEKEGELVRIDTETIKAIRSKKKQPARIRWASVPPGFNLKGFFLATISQPEKTLHHVENLEGNEFLLSGTSKLNSLFEMIKPGHYFELEYKGVKPLSSGKTFHDFSMHVDDEKIKEPVSL